ncbi:plasmodesmata-located protein 2-like isoform X3 [Primulina eburnea]|uniref:plasmodesmata-located protein 2-like isoform X3 n=1 Tax=Primulina eburnea TaxID=1245227 RepID=UPI003C6BEE83
MGPCPSLLCCLILSLFFVFVSSTDITDLVFEGCADLKFQDFNGVYRQTLKNLLETLKSQSSATKFYKTTSGDGPSAINGAFQCRGDLSNGDCNICVAKAPDLAENLCGQAIAARVQLNGCYLRDRKEYTEDSCDCAWRTCGCGTGIGLFVVCKISFQEKDSYIQTWWIEERRQKYKKLQDGI